MSPVICLLGPTATGKSELALELVNQLPCEIISVDSAMVYRHLDIGTAKPDAATRARIPHRLIDIVDPAESYSAARFRADALSELEAVTRRGRIPLLVGGTMLYFRALEQGLSALPGADANIRADIDRLAKAEGWAAIHARLAQVDPAAAARIHPNDPQRLQRALEVYRLTGRPLSDHFLHSKMRQEASEQGMTYRYIKFALVPADRVGLYARIERRFAAMLAQGLINEVSALYSRDDLNAALPAMRIVGYRQVWDYLSGTIDRSTMTDRAVIATRQLAKRQMTWLRGMADVRAYEAETCVTGELVADITTQLETAY